MEPTRALKFETILWSPWTSEEHEAAMNQVAQHRHQGTSIEVSLVQLTAAPAPGPLSLHLPEFGLVIRVLSLPRDSSQDDDVLSGFKTRRCDDDADIHDGEEEVCSICLDDLYRGSVTALDCGHEFHPGCIRRWLFRGKNFCPLCKAPAMKRPRVTLASLLEQ